MRNTGGGVVGGGVRFLLRVKHENGRERTEGLLINKQFERLRGNDDTNEDVKNNKIMR